MEYLLRSSHYLKEILFLVNGSGKPPNCNKFAKLSASSCWGGDISVVGSVVLRHSATVSG